ncbi:MAG TPA: immunoglobulin-like domain-containing protein [Solirubrobacterales bacterium]|nr:immunoglobulin-like domain-containing protein [Solirubrobacterales bacterium]
MALIGSVPARAKTGAEEFCEGGIVNEFGLSGLPPLANPFPERPAFRERQLPSFAPKTVSLELGGGPILTPGQEVGFWLSSDNYVGKTPLRWTLKDTIRPVDPSGDVGSVVAQGKVRVKYASAGHEVKDFLVPPRYLGAYRYDLKIESWDGTQLAEYSTYVWVEKKFWAPRLGLSSQVVHPGELLLSRPENMGTIEFSFGEEFRLQRKIGGSWTPIMLPGEVFWELWLGYAGAGGAGRCSELRVPRNFSPGKYRIVKLIERSLRGKPTFLAAPFTVSN